MRTLIIPCADGVCINERPKYLAHHPDGKLLLEKAAEGIHPEVFDRVLIILLEEEDRRFDAGNEIEKALQGKYPVEVVGLEERTKGPAETIYQGILKAGVNGQIVIKDVNNHICVSEIQDTNFIAGLNLTHWKEDIHNLRRSSFVILNEQRQVLDIIEKQFRSDDICVGLYGFRRASDYVFAYRRLSESGYPIKTLFVSHIISYLIGYRNHIFHYMETAEFEDWKDEQCYAELQRKYATYFLDLDQLFDGKEEAPILENLRALSAKGAECIGFISGGKSEAFGWEEYFRKNKIKCLSVVYGCMESEVKKILRHPAQVCECRYSL